MRSAPSAKVRPIKECPQALIATPREIQTRDTNAVTSPAISCRWSDHHDGRGGNPEGVGGESASGTDSAAIGSGGGRSGSGASSMGIAPAISRRTSSLSTSLWPSSTTQDYHASPPGAALFASGLLGQEIFSAAGLAALGGSGGDGRRMVRADVDDRIRALQNQIPAATRDSALGRRRGD